MPATQLIFTDNPGSVPSTYTVPGGLEFRVSSIFARFNGAAAAAAFVPCLDLLSQNGQLMARVAVSQTLAAGDSARVTWAPFLRKMTNLQEGLPAVGVDTEPAGQTVPTGTDQAVSFTAEGYDTDGMWTPAQPTRITCVTSGFYYITGNCTWAPNAVGYRRLRLRLNGGATILSGVSYMAVTTAGVQTDQVVAKAAWDAAAGDYIELIARQNSGGDLLANCALNVFRQSAAV